MAWILEYGDADGDGFVEYRRHTDRGFVNQGWKDSFNGVNHSDGHLAAPPIAVRGAGPRPGRSSPRETVTLSVRVSAPHRRIHR
jgi:hypothetical protein